MTAASYEELIRQIANEDRAGDSESLKMLAHFLSEVDQAKQMLRDKGYGVTGTPILKTVQEVPSAHEMSIT